MTKSVVRYLPCIASLTAMAAHPVAGQITSSPPTVEVSGHGEVHVAPDRAIVVLSVENKGATAAAVASANAAVQRRVLDTLKALGYSGSQASTLSYNVQPNYESVPGAPEQRQHGYIARNAVRVTVSQLDRVGTVIDAALARGANTVDGITFELSNNDAPRHQALADAATHARADADALATAMGGTLGPLISVTTQEQPAVRPVAYAMARIGGETPITPSEITVEATVTARWQFVPKP